MYKRQLGYSLEAGNSILFSFVSSYLSSPESHEFFDFFETSPSNAQGFLFFRYIQEQFGDQAIRDIVANPETGILNLEAQIPGGFSENFRRWSIANFATNLSGPVPEIFRYPSGFQTDGTFPNGTLPGVNTITLTNDTTTSTEDLLPWSVAYLRFNADTGAGLAATVTPAGASPFGLLLENVVGQFGAFAE